MAPLNIHPEETKPSKTKKNKGLKIALGIGALIAVPVITTTLAQTITINSSAAVQFGQGAIDTAACDTALTISATSAYSDNFLVKTITISDIDLETASTASTCAGKTLTVSAATTASPSIEGALSSGVTQISFTIPSNAGADTTPVTNLTSGVTATAGLVTSAGAAYKTNSTAVPYDETGKITLTITSPTLATTSLSKFLIQSS